MIAGRCKEDPARLQLCSLTLRAHIPHCEDASRFGSRVRDVSFVRSPTVKGLTKDWRPAGPLVTQSYDISSLTGHNIVCPVRPSDGSGRGKHERA